LEGAFLVTYSFRRSVGKQAVANLSMLPIGAGNPVLGAPLEPLALIGALVWRESSCQVAPAGPWLLPVLWWFSTIPWPRRVGVQIRRITMDYAEEHRSLHAAIATDAQPSTETVVRWVRRGLEQVLLPSVAASEYTALQMSVTRLGEDLSKCKPMKKGVMWDRIPLDEPLEWIKIKGWNEHRAARHQYLEAQVLSVEAGFPRFRRRLDGTTGQTETTVALTVPKRSLPGHHVDEELQQRAVEWLLGTFEDLGGTTGYTTVDFIGGPESPYERAVLFVTAERDFHRHLWGYYWGNLLNAEHVKLLGGPDAMQQAPVAIVRPVGRSGFYL